MNRAWPSLHCVQTIFGWTARLRQLPCSVDLLRLVPSNISNFIFWMINLLCSNLRGTDTEVHRRLSWQSKRASSLHEECSSKHFLQDRYWDDKLSFRTSPLVARVDSLVRPINWKQKIYIPDIHCCSSWITHLKVKRETTSLVVALIRTDDHLEIE